MEPGAPVDESFFAEVVRYVGFDEADQAALRRFHPRARPHFEAVADAFYRRVGEHPAAAAILRNPASVERLSAGLRGWMELLFSGPWDEAYRARRARIGQAHVKVGLPQRYMLTAMSVIRQAFEAVLAREVADAGERAAIAAALGRVLDVELAIMLESYHEGFVSAVQRFERAGKSVLERRLAISEARYQAMIEDAGVAVVAVERDGRVVLFNRRAEEISELSRDHVCGQNLYDMLCHPHDRGPLEAAVTAAVGALDLGPPPPLVGRIVTATGTERWMRWHVTTLATGAAPLACAIGTDITEERALEQRTRRAESLASLGTLAAGLAHEIRNPLNAAQLQLMLVERRIGRLAAPDSTGATEAARTVREELHRLAGLVEDFLAFARPTELRIAGGDLRETAAAVVHFVGPDAEQAGVGLALDAGEAVFARYDEERIKQVILNLLRNAMEAAGPGGDARVSVKRAAESVAIEVSDSGGGLPIGVAIFEPFTTTKQAGTGLGLTIVHRIVHDHGGTINPVRRAGRTVFHVELPLDGPHAAEPST